jgi:hypothetical protein
MASLDIDTALGWRGRTVVDRDGEKIGKLDELYLDESERPAWGAITTGLFGRRQSFVPLGAIESDGDNLRVPFEKDRVKDAPNVEPDAQLSDEEEDRLYRHYGVQGGGGDAGGERPLQHRPRLAGVANDQDLRPLGLQRSGGGAAQRRRQLGAEEGAGLSPDPVGSEELARGSHPALVSAC